MHWDLPDDMVAASVARGHAARWAADTGWMPEEADDLVLVVSELVANGVRHGSPPVALRIEPTDDAGALVTVTDAGSGSLPAAQEAGDDEGHGRGLSMVEALSSQTGWSRGDGTTTVWARIRPPARVQA